MKYKFVGRLFEGQLDIVGYIHAEIDSIENLMLHLGYDQDGNHPENRKLIFIGDLCDRDIDSISVIKLVQRLVINGNAQ